MSADKAVSTLFFVTPIAGTSPVLILQENEEVSKGSASVCRQEKIPTAIETDKQAIGNEEGKPEDLISGNAASKPEQTSSETIPNEVGSKEQPSIQQEETITPGSESDSSEQSPDEISEESSTTPPRTEDVSEETLKIKDPLRRQQQKLSKENLKANKMLFESAEDSFLGDTVQITSETTDEEEGS